MTTDKTGAPTTVTQESDRFSISVNGQKVGFVEFADRDGQRVFTHTEVLDEFGGRGLATILVDDALTESRDAGLRIVAVCPLVVAFVKNHHEFDDAVDPEFQPARLTVDLFRPAALTPVRVDTTVTRQGRRLWLVDSVMAQADTVVARTLSR